MKDQIRICNLKKSKNEEPFFKPLDKAEALRILDIAEDPGSFSFLDHNVNKKACDSILFWMIKAPYSMEKKDELRQSVNEVTR